MTDKNHFAEAPTPVDHPSKNVVFDPETRQLAETTDLAGETLEYAKANPMAEKKEKEFLENRLDTSRFPFPLRKQEDNWFTDKSRHELESDVTSWRGPGGVIDAATAIDRWVWLEPGAAQPGRGHGNGIYFFPGTLPFLNWTSISFRMIVAAYAGGGLVGSLYLTSSNRSRYGVEVYVDYSEQSPPTLTIFDLAKVGTALPAYINAMDNSRLSTFFISEEIGGVQYDTLRMINETYRLAGPGSRWCNLAYLQQPDGKFFKLYEYFYSLNAGQTQVADKIGGFWGPIVETFAEVVPPINAMGFGAPVLVQDGYTKTLVWSGNQTTSNIVLLLREHGLRTPINLPSYGFIID